MTLPSNLNEPHTFICNPLTKACKCILHQSDKSLILFERIQFLGGYNWFSFERDTINLTIQYLHAKNR